MDNGGFQRDLEEGTELGLVRNSATTNGTSSSGTPTIEPSTSCRPEVCQAARRRYQAPDLSDSPWHNYKTIALIVTIVLFIIWIITYTVLSQLDIV